VTVFELHYIFFLTELISVNLMTWVRFPHTPTLKSHSCDFCNKSPNPQTPPSMGIEAVDDFVWEHYESWPGYDGFRAWLNRLSWRNIMWTTRIHDYAETKYHEHQAKHTKLRLFKNSLTRELSDCVIPFMDQQEKLIRAYRSILYEL